MECPRAPYLWPLIKAEIIIPIKYESNPGPWCTEIIFFLFCQVVLAKEAGLSYAAVALVTDYDCWRENETTVSSHLDVITILVAQ